jgi:hypothetical protein
MYNCREPAACTNPRSPTSGKISAKNDNFGGDSDTKFCTTGAEDKDQTSYALRWPYRGLPRSGIEASRVFYRVTASVGGCNSGYRSKHSPGLAEAATIRAGADGVWVGTRLIASTEAAAHPECQRRLVEARSRPVTTTAFGREWPAQRYRLLPTRTVAEWAGREHEIPDPPPGPEIIGHTILFPHSAAMPYDMPKFSAIPPGPDTTGDWDEMACPAGDGVTRIHDIRPAGQIITDMMAEAHALLSGQPETTS